MLIIEELENNIKCKNNSGKMTEWMILKKELS